MLVAFSGLFSASKTDGAKRFQFIVPLFLMLAVFCLLMRVQVTSAFYDWKTTYYPTHMRIDSLLCGVALGYLNQYYSNVIQNRMTWWPFVTLATVIALSLPAVWVKPDNRLCGTIGYSILYLCFAVLVQLAVQYPRLGQNHRIFGPSCRLLAHLGVYSYTIYLAHSFIPMTPGFESARVKMVAFVSSTIGTSVSVWASRVGFILLSIGLGILLSHAIERPFLKLRSRWFPSHHVIKKSN